MRALVGQKLGEILGQTLVIENRPNAGGRPAAEFVTNQPADGYMLFVGASGVMSISSAVYPKLAYHPTKSFIPLTHDRELSADHDEPDQQSAEDRGELVAYAKANPDKSNYAHDIAGLHDRDRIAEAEDRHARRRHSAGRAATR